MSNAKQLDHQFASPLFTLDAVQDWLSDPQPLTVTVAMTTHQAGVEETQGPIRLKNMLRKAEEATGDRKLSAVALEKLSDLAHDRRFWQHQSRGLVAFIRGDEVRMFSLPSDPGETVCVGSYPDLSAFASSIDSLDTYNVLTLAWEQAQLWTANRFSLMPHPALADSIEFSETVEVPDPHRELQASTSQPRGKGGVGRPTPNFHGQGEGEDSIEGERMNYLSRVAAAVASALHNDDSPLVLVATTEVAGHFETRSQLEVAAKVIGAPRSFDTKTIHNKTLEAIEPLRKRRWSEHRDRIGTAIGGGQGSQDPAEIIQAAAGGRIDTLSVVDGHCLAGTYDADQSQASIGEAGDQSENLIAVAIALTASTGGKVVGHPRTDDVNVKPLAAVYRY